MVYTLVNEIWYQMYTTSIVINQKYPLYSYSMSSVYGVSRFFIPLTNEFNNLFIMIMKTCELKTHRRDNDLSVAT